jgi:hypothetical protein
MDVGESPEMMVRKATGMVVSMVSVVVSTLKRLRDEPEPDTEPNPLLYSLELVLRSTDREPCKPSTIPQM